MRNPKKGGGSGGKDISTFEAAVGTAIIELAHEGGGRVWLHAQGCRDWERALSGTDARCTGCEPTCFTVLPGAYTVTTAKVLEAFKLLLEAKLGIMKVLRRETTALDGAELIEILALLDGELES